MDLHFTCLTLLNKNNLKVKRTCTLGLWKLLAYIIRPPGKWAHHCIYQYIPAGMYSTGDSTVDISEICSPYILYSYIILKISQVVKVQLYIYLQLRVLINQSSDYKESTLILFPVIPYLEKTDQFTSRQD